MQLLLPTIDNKGVVEEVWPGESFVWVLLQQPLKEAAELLAHVSRPLHSIPAQGSKVTWDSENHLDHWSSENTPYDHSD